jgi:hypothetical protein
VWHAEAFTEAVRPVASHVAGLGAGHMRGVQNIELQPNYNVVHMYLIVDENVNVTVDAMIFNDNSTNSMRNQPKMQGYYVLNAYDAEALCERYPTTESQRTCGKENRTRYTVRNTYCVTEKINVSPIVTTSSAHARPWLASKTSCSRNGQSHITVASASVDYCPHHSGCFVRRKFESCSRNPS